MHACMSSPDSGKSVLLKRPSATPVAQIAPIDPTTTRSLTALYDEVFVAIPVDGEDHFRHNHLPVARRGATTTAKSDLLTRGRGEHGGGAPTGRCGAVRSRPEVGEGGGVAALGVPVVTPVEHPVAAPVAVGRCCRLACLADEEIALTL